MALQGILTDLARYLEHAMDEGVREIEVFPEEVGGLDNIRIRKTVRPTRSDIPPQRAPAALRSIVSAPAAAAAPAAAPSGRAAALDLPGIAAEVAVCEKCRLHETRTRTVPGQ